MLVAAERPAGPLPRIRMSALKGGAISVVFGFKGMIWGKIEGGKWLMRSIYLGTLERMGGVIYVYVLSENVNWSETRRESPGWWCRTSANVSDNFPHT